MSCMSWVSEIVRSRPVKRIQMYLRRYNRNRYRLIERKGNISTCYCDDVFDNIITSVVKVKCAMKVLLKYFTQPSDPIRLSLGDIVLSPESFNRAAITYVVGERRGGISND